MEVFDLKVTIGKNVFNNKIVTLAVIDQPVLFTGAKYVKGKTGHYQRSSSRSNIRIEACGTIKYFSLA